MAVDVFALGVVMMELLVGAPVPGNRRYPELTYAVWRAYMLCAHPLQQAWAGAATGDCGPCAPVYGERFCSSTPHRCSFSGAFEPYHCHVNLTTMLLIASHVVGCSTQPQPQAHPSMMPSVVAALRSPQCQQTVRHFTQQRGANRRWRVSAVGACRHMRVAINGVTHVRPQQCTSMMKTCCEPCGTVCARSC